MYASKIRKKEGDDKRMDEDKQTVIQKTVKSGISFGSALAIVVSYTA